MGKAYQAWSAASYVAAYLRFQGDKTVEVADGRPEEIIQCESSDLNPNVTNESVDLDQGDSAGATQKNASTPR
jgi:hypothetical protein